MAHLSGWSRALLVLTLLVPTLTGCGSTQAHTTPPASLDPTVEWNRLARAGSTVDLLHGVEVQDPYRSLEVDSPETQAWINQQTERTTDALAPFESATANERIEALTEKVRVGALSNATAPLHFSRSPPPVLVGGHDAVGVGGVALALARVKARGPSASTMTRDPST